MIWDVAILETKNGGDFTLKGNDFGVVNSIENALYLKWFGGNVEASINPQRQAGEQDFSYWGNFFIPNADAQFNSLTERTLNTIPLNSAARSIIENVMKKDLASLSRSNNISVSVEIVSTDRIKITLKAIMQDGSEKVKSFQYVKVLTGTGDFFLIDFNFNDFF